MIRSHPKRVRAGVLALACAAVMAGAAPSAQAVSTFGQSFDQWGSVVFTQYPGGYFHAELNPVGSTVDQPSVGALLQSWVNGVVSSSWCAPGNYASVNATNDLQVYTLTDTQASATIRGTAYDECAGFNRSFVATVSFTDNGPLQTTTGCCNTYYDYVVAERDQSNGPGTGSFTWTSSSAGPGDATAMGPQYNNAQIGEDVVVQP